MKKEKKLGDMPKVPFTVNVVVSKLEEIAW